MRLPARTTVAGASTAQGERCVRRVASTAQPTPGTGSRAEGKPAAPARGGQPLPAGTLPQLMDAGAWWHQAWHALGN